MIVVSLTLNTAGDGYWSRRQGAVVTDRLTVPYVNENHTFGELRVYFKPDTWSTARDGLIYTDSQFLAELRRELVNLGLDAAGVDYSEQGMQGKDYVSLDVGEQFLTSWFDRITIRV